MPNLSLYVDPLVTLLLLPAALAIAVLSMDIGYVLTCWLPERVAGLWRRVGGRTEK